MSHEKGLGRAQVLCYGSLPYNKLRMYLNIIHLYNNIFAQHIHTNLHFFVVYKCTCYDVHVIYCV